MYCREWWRRVQHTRNMFWIRWYKKFIKLFFIYFFIFILDIYFTNTNKQINTVKPIANYKFIWKFKFASSLQKTKIVLLTWPLKNKIQSWIKKQNKTGGKLVQLVHLNLKRKKSKNTLFYVFFKCKNKPTWGNLHDSVSHIMMLKS